MQPELRHSDSKLLPASYWSSGIGAENIEHQGHSSLVGLFIGLPGFPHAFIILQVTSLASAVPPHSL